MYYGTIIIFFEHSAGGATCFMHYLWLQSFSEGQKDHLVCTKLHMHRLFLRRFLHGLRGEIVCAEQFR
jgi:hypothetical protein